MFIYDVEQFKWDLQSRGMRFLSRKELEVRSSLIYHVISLNLKYSNGGIDTSIGTSTTSVTECN